MLYLCQEWPKEERIPAVSCIPKEAREDLKSVLRWLQELPEAEGFYDESCNPREPATTTVETGKKRRRESE